MPSPLPEKTVKRIALEVDRVIERAIKAVQHDVTVHRQSTKGSVVRRQDCKPPQKTDTTGSSI